MAACLCWFLLLANTGAAAVDPLSAWNDGPAKQAILNFVARVSDAGSPDFVRPQDRIAAFDNDGTLWPEQPLYVQAQFAIDRVRQLAPQHPEWRQQAPFRDVLVGDPAGALGGGEPQIMALIMATHAGMTTDEFRDVVSQWITTARHPRFHRPYPELAYQPMLELLQMLRAEGFRTYIVSGGGVEFMRPWIERTYGIAPEQVIGSTIRLKYEVRDGRPALQRLAAVDSVNDGPGKPAGIQRVIGRPPLMAFGNSDGDREMLEWTAAQSGPRLAVLIHHTDAVREWAYDRSSKVGKLDAALDQGRSQGWTVVDMKRDWNRVFAFDGEKQ